MIYLRFLLFYLVETLDVIEFKPVIKIFKIMFISKIEEKRMKFINREIITSLSNRQMAFKDGQDLWEKWKKSNLYEGYDAKVFEEAKKFADAFEAQNEKENSKSLETFFHMYFFILHPLPLDIAGNQLEAIVEILSKTWEYGQELHNWFYQEDRMQISRSY